MKKFSWFVAAAVFLAFFAIYSYRLGVKPALMHDDYEYTYPSFSLAARGDFGSPLLGPGFNIEKRTYSLTVYYYASVHAALIRVFGDGAQSIPLANVLHFGLLAAAGAFFLIRRRAFVGVSVFLYALTSDARMVEAARHGRPEMTAGFCVTMAVLTLWVWADDGRRRPLVLFGMSAALTAGILTHTSVIFFTAALLLAFALPILRKARPRDIVVWLIPYATIPLLYTYFVLTDNLANIQGQMAPGAGDVMLRRLLPYVQQGEWDTLAQLTVEFFRSHLGQPALWLGVPACLLLPVFVPNHFSRGSRFFAGVYCLCVLVNFLFLKHFVLTYQAIYQAVLYLAFAFLAEAAATRLTELSSRASWTAALRFVCVGVLLLLSVGAVWRFRDGLRDLRPPFARLQAALVDGLLESGARPGDRVYVPSPFGFHLAPRFDVVAYPAPKYFQGRWSPAFRDGLREIWGAETLAQADAWSLCYAMGLAYIRPKWIVSWTDDYSVMRPFQEFLRRYSGLPGMRHRIQGLPGMRLIGRHRGQLPWPYGGLVRVYEMNLSDAVLALDRTVHSETQPCP
jgi:hypothetical protein